MSTRIRRLGVSVALVVVGLSISGCKKKAGKAGTGAPDESAERKSDPKSKGSKAEDSDDPEPRDAPRERNAKDLEYLTVDGERCSRTGKREHQVDVNQDGYADLVTLYASDAGSEKLACKQADLNYDGRLDAFVYYEPSGEVAREQFDQDFDGRIDMGRFYAEGKLARDEIDLNQDGFADSWRIYDEGRLVRVESDRDADGKADMFTYYMGKQIDRIGYDVNGDGKVDTWDHDAARRARLALQKRQSAPEGKPDEEVYVDEQGEAEGDESKSDDKPKDNDDKPKDKPKSKTEDKPPADPAKQKPKAK